VAVGPKRSKVLFLVPVVAAAEIVVDRHSFADAGDSFSAERSDTRVIKPVPVAR
jgi:hypothetical protein